MGIALITIIYADSDDPNAGLASLPILILHPVQLVIAGILAPIIRKRKPVYQALEVEPSVEVVEMEEEHAEGLFDEDEEDRAEEREEPQGDQDDPHQAIISAKEV